MQNLIDKALVLTSETQDIEFKSEFNTSDNEAWIEIIKDIVAIANSGGGLIIIGLDDTGTPVEIDVTAVLTLDPATITNKLYKYTSQQIGGIRVQSCIKSGHQLAAILIDAVSIPIVFEKPGNYSIGGGKQKTAFSSGTVYFRHGAKSEPGSSNDLRKAIERRIDELRESWLGNIRSVIEAPIGSHFIAVSPAMSLSGIPVRLTSDPNAVTVAQLDSDNTHPYRSKELCQVVNSQLPAEVDFNSHDAVCIKSVYEIEKNPDFCHRPKYGWPQYSPEYVRWILDQYIGNSAFFAETRQKYREKQAATK